MRLPLRKHQGDTGRATWVARLRMAFYGLLLLLTLSLVFAFDATYPVLEHLILTIVEFAEQEIEVFFAHTIGLEHYYAQMATAWLGFFLLLLFGILLIRKVIRITRQAKAKLPEWKDHQKEVALTWWQHVVESILEWWGRQSWPRRIALIVAGVLFAVPLFWALSLVLVTLISLILGI
jgi:hypothetical protein